MDYDIETKDRSGVKYPFIENSSWDYKKYEEENSSNKNLFSIKSNQKTNEYLKEIADLCNIKKNVTFHTARHNKMPYRLLTSILHAFCF